MQDSLLSSIENALKNDLYYVAFISSLTLPDLCGGIDEPGLGSEARFIKWFDTYVDIPKYIIDGQEAYALRCLILHSGNLSTLQFNARRGLNRKIALDDFYLYKKGGVMRMTNVETSTGKYPNTIRFDLYRYIKTVVKGVRAWEVEKGKKLQDYDQIFDIKDTPETLMI